MSRPSASLKAIARRILVRKAMARMFFIKWRSGEDAPLGTERTP